jgi:competence protein ComEA
MLNQKNEIRCGLSASKLARAALAALAIATLASVPHAEAQRRPVAAQAATAGASDDAAPSDASGVVNIQTASVEELQRLPGIGPSKAAAIVAQRERSAFRRVEDILRVRGIGRATFRRLRPMITVSGPTTLAEEARSPRRSRAAVDADGAEDEQGSR